MSYNPTRSQGNRNEQRQQVRQAAQQSTRKPRHTVGAGSAAPDGDRTATLHGFRTAVYACPSFVNYFDCLYPANAHDFGVTFTGHKSIRVIKGSLYITTCVAEKEGEAAIINPKDKQVSKVLEGSFINIPAGVAYAIASSGTTAVEMLVTESPDYNHDWVSVEGGVITEGDSIVLHSPSAIIDGKSRRVGSTQEREVMAERATSRRQRQTAAQDASKRPAATTNINSSTVIGVNPMPAILVEE